MLKGRGRDPRILTSPPPAPAHLASVLRGPTLAHHAMRPTTPSMQRAPLARPEPDYEVVEFPSEQYVNAKIQPPPPPPPRPPTGHPADAGASCGLCGGGGARVRCAECGRRALCASCDDMYHRHPKRRHHQRQALSQSQLRDERPPLPPKTAPPVPPPRKHKVGGDRMNASPKQPVMDQRRATLSSPHHMAMMMGQHVQAPTVAPSNHIGPHHVHQQMPQHLQSNLTPIPTPNHLGSMPYLPTNMHLTANPAASTQGQSNTLAHVNSAWNRPRGSLQNFGHPNMVMPAESWENPDNIAPTMQSWARPLRRGASVLELSGGTTTPCAGCAHCAPMPWRYGSCASLDHPWANTNPGWAPTCCAPGHPMHNTQMHPHSHIHPPQTPQPYRRAESRAVSRAASRAGSRAASPAMSVRSRTSRRPKHRTPSPQPLPSSDADSESESESDRGSPSKLQEKEEDSLGPAPAPPSSTWQCEHCTYVNEPGVRVCAICCRTPVSIPKTIAKDISENIERLKISHNESPRVIEKHRIEREVQSKPKSKKERTSTGCGPSPPRDGNISKKPMNRLITPTQEQHDIAVGPSPPREVQNGRQTCQDMSTEISPSRDTNKTMRVSPFRDSTESSRPEVPRHGISIGPSPPHNNSYANTTPHNSSINVQKVSTGTSPPRDTNIERRSSSLATSKANVSNTGTSPPPQSISTQTYEVPNTNAWDRAPSVARSRPKRRFRDDNRRERSQSRHSMSSDTRESDRSIRTAGTGSRWEWRERDSSPGGEWGESSNRLSRRASHLDLRRTHPNRRSTYYGSEAASPERQSNTRAISLEALAGAGARREAERGMELAQLMSEAETLGFSAAEVQAALIQSPAAPLAWLRERWPSLCAGVRAAAARLASTAAVTELEARAALARHRGAMWPAVTECVARHRRQTEVMGIGEEERLRGHVWGSPVGVEDDAVPPRSSSRQSHRMRAEDSSDEFQAPTPPKFQDDDWMYLPLNMNINDYERDDNLTGDIFSDKKSIENKDEVANKIKMLLHEAGVPLIDENVLMQGLLSGFKPVTNTNVSAKTQPIDLIQSENDFIDAYNALTRASPLPNINKSISGTVNENSLATDPQNIKSKGELNLQETSISKNSIFLEDTYQNNHKIDHINHNQTFEAEQNIKHIQNLQPKQKIKDSDDELIQLTDSKTSKTSSLDLKEQTTSEENVLQCDVIEEKSTNLTDIVDNTQRLIQQMKEEINSDINSIDDRTISQSEADDSSSDETNNEQESSYSGTEERTDNLTSDENEITSSEDDDSALSEKRQMYRTSSEENENFEEALDHVESQLEDFKHANIEMLDSIARTLQEEHTYTVEINHINTQDISRSARKQDLNNNIFTTVNSFEEIYEELNTNNNDSNILKENQVINKNTKDNLKIIHIPRSAKQTANLSVIKNVPATKLIISENKYPILNAVLEKIGENQNNNSCNTKNDQEFNSDETNTQSGLEHVELNAMLGNIRENENIILNTSQAEQDVKTMIENSSEKQNTQSNDTQIELAVNIASMSNETGSESGSQQVEFNAMVDNIDEKQNIHSNDTQNEQEVDIEFTPHEIDTDPDLEHFELKISNQIDQILGMPPSPAESDNTTLRVSLNLENNGSYKNAVRDIPLDSTKITNSSEAIAGSFTQRERTPTKVSTDTTSDINSIKSSIANKSNIPKLIKIMPNNKLKNDKSAPKLIVSKVPVRRTSFKQYPAPAPPKSHFGNIQSGHVKQLQTRLFNNKELPSKPIPISSETPEVKATTSTTLSKKKQAPPPPFKKPEDKKISPPKTATLPPKEKKQYFRETCRTEDEWTDSDSEDSQLQIVRPTEDSNYSPPSPPPPITVRRVSGQIIDLAKVRLSEGSPERQARMLLAEGATETWEQAQLAVELISQGADPPAALLAALECVDLKSALAYLYQDCELCASRLPEHEMVSMLRCTHRCCRECAHHYFTVQITERSIADCVCPYCKLPELESLPEDAWLEYFAHLDILLKTLVEIDVHELFQRKLRDRTLARDPNFRWCMECSSGFFVHPKQKKVRCPECRSISCASCRKPWNANHEGLSCEQYTAWLEDNDPERSVTAIQQHLRDNGLECPRCHFKYSLSRGGCMHFTCTQCKYEFCYGCGKPFTMGARCGLSEYCAKLGLHAHHPRNCLFYLRDKEPHELQTLLQMNNVTYETNAAEGSTGRCPVQLQRETPTGLIDGTCGSDSPANYAGLCKNHYLEYLSRLVRRCSVDPLPILGVDDLETLVRRAALRPPPRPYGTLDGLYKRGLVEIVKEKIPLD